MLSAPRVAPASAEAAKLSARTALALRAAASPDTGFNRRWIPGAVVDFVAWRPPQEVEGRKLALQKLVNDLVDGAQSQW